MKPLRPESLSVHAKFATTRAEMAAALIERDEIDLVLNALIARSTSSSVRRGAPSSAARLADEVGGRDEVRVLLTKYTVPEEVVGPVSLAGLKGGR
jgi:hypothetical protein